MDQVKIGKFIAAKRKEKKMTQEELADKLGVTNKAISKWENGHGMPELSLIKKLCDELGISVTALLNGEENKDDEIVMRLLWCIDKLRMLKWAIAGLLICNIAQGIEHLDFLQEIPSDTFMKGFLNGGCAALKIVGIAVFAYGLALYFKKAEAEKNNK